MKNETIEQAFERADALLYTAKATGRDRVVAEDTRALGIEATAGMPSISLIAG